MTPARSVHVWRRRITALAILAATLLAAGFVFLVGVFSDWSGEHKIPPQTTAAAIGILVLGSFMSLWVLRRGR